MTEPEHRTRRRWLRRAGLVVLAGILALVGGGLWLEQRLWSATATIEGVFDGLTDRPADGRSGTRDVLVVMTLPESGLAVPTDHWYDGEESGLLLMHLDAEVSEPVVVALPPDLARTTRDPDPGSLVAAVEARTGVRIDHLVVCEWRGLAEVATDVGGAPVTEKDTHRRIDLEGTDLLSFVAGLDVPDSPDRVDVVAGRRLAVVRSVLDEALSQEMRKRPWRAYRLVHTVAGYLSVDDRWSRNELRGIAWSVRGLRSAWIEYLLTPRDPGDQAGLWTALRDDQAADWIADHPASVVPDEVP